MNVRQLVNLLHIATNEDAMDLSVSAEKKRTAKPLSRSSKRVKLSNGLVTRDMSQTSSDDFVWPDAEYPHLSSKAEQYLEDVEAIPTFQHVYEIQYSRLHPESLLMGPHKELQSGWKSEENHLLEILVELYHSISEPRTIDLGPVHFAEFLGRLVVKDREGWLLLLPSLFSDINLAWHDIASQSVGDICMAFYILQSAGRVRMKGRLNMVVHPSNDQQEFPFHLQVVANVSLLVPSIFEPLSTRGTKRTLSELGDAQRRALNFLYPSAATTPDSFHGTINIPFFYSILGPAPPLLCPSADEAIQPAKLLPTLLPFQRRSVAWLLHREGKTVTLDGKLVPRSASDDFTLWDKVEEGSHTWYLHRLSGLLSPTLPQMPPILGGILAEEPGLGKTLETIALILLNPAPSDRNPTVRRWDPEAKLEVRAIKSTLIVTPPTLASQWADELAAHAPSLKVLVYDGWSKVTVPITQTQVEEQRVKMQKAQAKALKKAIKLKAKNTGKNKKNADAPDEMDVDLVHEQAEDIEILDWYSYVNAFDVVITTYAVLRSDFNVARAVPDRPRREDVVYTNLERPRSPLVMVEWNRVIMDEVQMVGGGKTEDMVSLIPRLSSFAVSGTPARAQVADLMHVLKFLRIDNVIGSSKLWNRMITSGFGAAHFAQLFQSYAIRTLKINVQEELTIPQQTRYLVSVPLGRVEKHVYDQTLETALQELGLDARGVAASEGWEVDGVLLRSSLRRLRGICTHPQVGQLQKPGDKILKTGGVKTMDDVLQSMKDMNWRTMMDDFKAKVQELIRFSQLQQRDESDLKRYQHALDTLLIAEKEAVSMIEEITTALAEHTAKGLLLKKDAAAADNVAPVDDVDKGKGKERQVSEDPSEVVDSEDGDLPHTLAGEEHGKKSGALQNRLRECRLTLHQAKFLQGDIYHILGLSQSEDEAYGAAEKVRHDLLKGTEEDAKRAMAQLTQGATKKHLTREALLLSTPFLDESGIVSLTRQLKPTKEELANKPQPQKVGLYNRAVESHERINEVNQLIADVLNEQCALIWEWRTTIISLLTQKLSPGEGEADGEEYQRTLDNQGEAETYLQSYTAILADRRQALINERTLLAAHDQREKKLRHTKAAIKAAAAHDDGLEIPLDVELQPEHEVLHKNLSIQRKEFLKCLDGRAVRSILFELHSTYIRITKDNDPEKALLKSITVELRQLIAAQGTLLDKLDADLALLRKAFNQRILYFRQLQEISDSVTEVTWESTIQVALQESAAERNELEAKINTSRARHRYLEHLAQNKEDGDEDEDEESCILCRCDFVRGYITQCAHIFCELCLMAWLRKNGKTCPVCRVPIDPDTIQRFTLNPPEEQQVSKPKPVITANKEAVPMSRRQIVYNMINSKLLQEIQTMESFGDFGSKIQTIVRHLLYLQMTDPGAKSIVFSAWADSLHILQRALKVNGIRCLRIDQKSKGEGAAKMFKNDPNILVLLLHGERENAGLNVTCASRVFLLESVVHHAFEVQAIARIDRMGQTRPTEVFCYYAEDTVERNILDLAARKGVSLYTKQNSAGTVNIASLAPGVEKEAIDAPVRKVQKGDFISKLDDMLAILFPHMYEDLEYLLPPEDTAMEGEYDHSPQLRVSGGVIENAVAGPSRLSYNYQPEDI